MPDNPDSAAAIENHWAGFFADNSTGNRVLDVATGNGVLLVWAARAARATGRQLTLTGIDLADIDPARFLPEYRADLSAARFVGRTAAESLPFADGSFDTVVSQYGLEYAELEQALSEAARVLAPGGRLHWLAHDADSMVVGQGRAKLADIDLLLASEGPFAAMKAYVQARTRRRKVTRATRDLTEALGRAEAHCAANPSATLVQQLCGAIRDTANRFETYHPADVEHWLAENLERLRGERQRTRDLLTACLSGQRLARVEKVLGTEPWSDADIAPLYVGAAGASVGQLIRADRL